MNVTKHMMALYIQVPVCYVTECLVFICSDYFKAVQGAFHFTLWPINDCAYLIFSTLTGFLKIIILACFSLLFYFILLPFQEIDVLDASCNKSDQPMGEQSFLAIGIYSAVKIGHVMYVTGNNRDSVEQRAN